MPQRITAYGERGWLIGGFDVSSRQRITKTLDRYPPPGFAEHVWGHDNLLVLFHDPVGREVVSKWLAGLEESTPATRPNPVMHHVPVIYDGPDLEAVAGAVGVSIGDLIGIHSSPLYTVRMTGFTPGFPYLDGLDPRLHLPRKASPRKRIQPGSVAIGGGHAGIYTVASPGGWHLLGRTETCLFDSTKAVGENPDLSQVFRLEPGDTVKFEPRQ